MNGNFDVWKLLAGLGIFLFGMFLLEEAIKALSGKAFKKLIRSYTDGRLKAIGSGSLVSGEVATGVSQLLAESLSIAHGSIREATFPACVGTRRYP